MLDDVRSTFMEEILKNQVKVNYFEMIQAEIQ